MKNKNMQTNINEDGYSSSQMDKIDFAFGDLFDHLRAEIKDETMDNEHRQWAAKLYKSMSASYDIFSEYKTKFYPPRLESKSSLYNLVRENFGDSAKVQAEYAELKARMAEEIERIHQRYGRQLERLEREMQRMQGQQPERDPGEEDL